MKSRSSPATSFPAGELAPVMEVFIGAKLQRKGAGSRKCEFLRWQPPVPGCTSVASGLGHRVVRCWLFLRGINREDQ